MSDILEVTALAAGGDGVARDEGRVTFIPRSAVGDRVRVRLVESKKSFARGALKTLEREGPGRRVAPCPHYARCGGCTLEHLE